METKLDLKEVVMEDEENKVPGEVREAVVSYRPTVTPRGEPVRSSADVVRMAGEILGGLPTERFLTFALDTRGRVLGWSLIGVGSVAACPISPSDAYRYLVVVGAAAAVFVHNHPSGDPHPSPEDIALCSRLSDGGKLLGIRVLDFVIVADGGAFSFLDAGLLR